MNHNRQQQMEAFGRLLDVLETLREQCPWDRKQTRESLRGNTIEETYELSDAILRNDMSDIEEELGDVMMHMCFYSIIGQEQQQYDIASVLRRQADKLIYRHPHIYHPSQVGADHPLPMSDERSQTTVENVLTRWEQLKKAEHKGDGDEPRRVLSGVPTALPTLIKAFRVQEKAANVGFDWPERDGVWEKVFEEIGELKAEMQKTEQAVADGTADKATARRRCQEELGDLLFSIVNAARLYKLNPDDALETTTQKFISRFNYIEDEAIRQHRELSDLTLEEMDQYWNEAKRKTQQ